MPWLFYADSQSILSTSQMELRTTFDADGRANYVDTFSFYLAAYSLNGKFLGMQQLSTQLQVRRVQLVNTYHYSFVRNQEMQQLDS